MSTTTITGLPDATTPLTGNERVPMDQADTTVDATTQDIADLAGEAITAAIDTHDDEADPHNGASPTFADLTLTGLLTAPHIHGTLAGDVYVHVKNTSGGTLAANTAVYVTGSVGDTDRVEVAACDPTDPAKMPAIGLLKTALANNAEGDAVILGELRPTDTGSYGLGDELYVGAGGALVNSIPASGTVQHVGSVARVQAETGTIVVGIGAGMARVGFTGAYDDLSGTPTLGTAAALDVGTGANDVVQLDGDGKLPAVDGSNLTGISGSATVYYNRRPALHRGPLFYKTAATAISVTAGSVLNGVVYDTATAVTMPGSFTDNTDYAIWQHPTTGALVADASFTSAPAGATGGSIVGGFHHIPSGRPTAFNNGSPTVAAEILEYSIWDLTYRPSCPDPRGMACVDGRFWCDLYLCGSTSYAGTDFSAVPSSKIGLTIADENNPPLIPAIYGGDGSTTYSLVDSKEAGSWYDFAEVASSFGKRLLTWLEFQHAAFGGPENGSRGTDPGTVIWERASLWGLAQSTGTLWSWGSDVQGNTGGGWTSATGDRGDVYQSGYSAVILGGSWNDGSNSGSRCAAWLRAPTYALNNISARFAAGHLVTC